MDDLGCGIEAPTCHAQQVGVRGMPERDMLSKTPTACHLHPTNFLRLRLAMALGLCRLLAFGKDMSAECSPNGGSMHQRGNICVSFLETLCHSQSKETYKNVCVHIQIAEFLQCVNGVHQ